MTESVWWYTLAGFVLGLILSTLWEWLYFRRRRMRIENERIEELEAALRAQSAASRSADNSGPGGFAGGYQSPNVFLESEQETVDTVEVIVPEPLAGAPRNPAQPADGQYTTYQQFATTWPDPNTPDGRMPQTNGNGKARDKQKPGVPLAAAAGAIAGAALAYHTERERAAEQEVTAEPARDDPPAGAQTGAPADAEADYLPTTTRLADPPEAHETAAAFGSAPPETDSVQPVETAGTGAPSQPDPTTPAEPPAAPDAVSAASDTLPAPAALPSTSAEAASTSSLPAAAPAANRAAMPAASPATSADPPAAVPAATSAPAPATAPVSSTLQPDEAPPLSRAMAAIIASAFGRSLARERGEDPVKEETPVEEQVPVEEQAPAEKALPRVYDLLDSAPEPAPEPVPEAVPEAVPDPVSDVGTEQQPGASRGAPAASSAPAAGAVEDDMVLPLRAILPAATKPPPLSKNGNTPARSAQPAATAVPATGLEPEIEQVSNQLDSLIASLNGLIEKTQPLLEEPAETGGAPASLPATRAPENMSFPASAPAAAGEDEPGEAAISGPYAARNLSRMEYAVVQLMQSMRRLGRDVRSTLE